MSPFDPVKMDNERKQLEIEMAQPGFWDDAEKAGRINQRLKGIEDKQNRMADMNRRAEDIETLIEMGDESEDLTIVDEVATELNELMDQAEKAYLETLLTGEYDELNAILSLHAGAGGTEAQDWTSMLYRMYTRWCEKKGYAVKVLDFLEGDEAGVKAVTFLVEGLNAYGYLKAEKGVHRLVRISPFDASARRHTSFASLDVMPEIVNDDTIEIKSDDLRIDTYRSSGAGGQHINKTSSAIRITHLPTGIVVQCQNERSQLQNKETAMRMLRSKLAEVKARENEEKMLSIKGEMKKIEWGSQIRSYVFQPYTMVKDHRTGHENANVNAVMDGELDEFIQAYLIKL